MNSFKWPCGVLYYNKGEQEVNFYLENENVMASKHQKISSSSNRISPGIKVLFKEFSWTDHLFVLKHFSRSESKALSYPDQGPNGWSRICGNFEVKSVYHGVGKRGFFLLKIDLWLKY